MQNEKGKGTFNLPQVVNLREVSSLDWKEFDDISGFAFHIK